MNTLLKAQGRLRLFNKWALVECDREIAEYYNSLYSLEYFYKPKIQIPLWGAHISIIRGEVILTSLKDEIQDMEIEFYYIPKIESNGVHFWHKVICPILDDIRLEFDLNKSLIGYHLSIGNICDGTGKTTPESFS